MHSSPTNSSQTRSRTRVKICGITRPEDAVAAAEAGADAIGLQFYAKSPRVVSIEQAKAILKQLPPYVSVVGLFVNHSQQEVEATLSAVPLDLLQFHGDESAAFCKSFARPYTKAMRVKPEMLSNNLTVAYEDARGLLLDAWDDKLYGGTGKTFDWHAVEKIAASARIILAGGLTPKNVAEAIRIAKPWAVDVSSGVEISPGIKSIQLIKEFISEVHRV